MRTSSGIFIAAMSLLLAAGARAGQPDGAGRTLVNEAVIDAPVDTVWKLFTTPEGMRSWMAPVADVTLPNWLCHCLSMRSRFQ